MPLEIQGQLERVTFRSEETLFTIAKFRTSGKEVITVVGTLLRAQPGENLRLTGDWERHPKYGPQFRIESCETIVPVTLQGIEKYLGSGMIRGIGPVMAKRLVEKFGTATLEVIEKRPDRLSEVGGIGAKRIGMIASAWQEQKDVRDVMLFLQGHEVSTGYAIKIYRAYGKDAVRRVQENPYALADEIFGIGFRIADRIAKKLGIADDSPLRAEAGVLHMLGALAEQGHVFFPLSDLSEECGRILDIPAPALDPAIRRLAEKKKIVLSDQGGIRVVYGAELYASEQGVGRHLKRLLADAADLVDAPAGRTVAWAEEQLKLRFAPQQAEAIQCSSMSKVLVITGGPGTGKTTIINAILRIRSSAGSRVLLSAPTGRAAKRMTEATGQEAKTIHRLLEFSPRTNGFRRNESEPLAADCLILDEASMIDTLLMNQLLKAVPDRCSLILVGDIDQLPSVGPGNVLRDIIDSGAVPVVRLQEIYRQARESLIVMNAHRINKGEMPVLPAAGDEQRDFYFFETEDPDKAADMVLDLCASRIPSKFGFDPMKDIQVLSPMHKGSCGAVNLNAELQNRLNPSGSEVQRSGRTFRTGDKVMQIRNNYDREVFNGDIGRIVSIDREDQVMAVDFDGRRVDYDFQDLDELILAYAVSVHKSQGSEYPVVVLPLLTQHYLLLQRNLVYTAVTRGKRLVVIVGTKRALAIAIRNNTPQMRYSGLKALLSAASLPSPGS